MAEVSKAVSGRMAITNTVQSSIAVHGLQAGTALEQAVFPDGPPEKLTITGLLMALGDTLTRSLRSLAEADLSLSAERADDPEQRRGRDAAAAAVRAMLVRLSALISGLYGPATLAAYGLAGETPVNPQELLLAAGKVANRLRTIPFATPPLVAATELDREKVAADLDALAGTLASALSAVERETREEQLAARARDGVMTRHDDVYQGVATAIEGLYRLAGRKDLAELVRPTSRRRQGLPEPADETAAPAPTAADPVASGT